MKGIEVPLVSPIYKTNRHYLAINEIRHKLFEIQIPIQKIAIYNNVLLTPTNHLFYRKRYIPSGLVSNRDDKKLTFVKKNWLNIKFNIIKKAAKHHGAWLFAFDLWANNYYHWMCEWLPRAYILKKEYPDGVFFLPAQMAQTKHITQSLDFLSIPVVFLDMDVAHRFSVLITIETEGFDATVNPLLQKELRNKLLENRERTIQRKIYISRANAKYRKIVNEKDLIELLSRYGYDILRAEDYDFHEQIRLFSGCTHLIGLHGAGHTNMMFMPKGAKVMEIRNNELTSQPFCFWRLANIFDLSWHFFQGEPIDEVSNFGDIKIDIELFEQELIRFEQMI